jgi:hypothetical protein
MIFAALFDGAITNKQSITANETRIRFIIILLCNCV